VGEYSNNRGLLRVSPAATKQLFNGLNG
jgi:hypothetical protein